MGWGGTNEFLSTTHELMYMLKIHYIQGLFISRPDCVILVLIRPT